MTERLTPGMLRDLADLDDAWAKASRSNAFYTLSWTGFLREEAARREAEQKPWDRVCPDTGKHCDSYKCHDMCDGDRIVGEREGLDSADAPIGTRPHTLAEWSAPLGDKPAPAADDLVMALRDENGGVWWVDPKDRTKCRPLTAEAADRIEAQAREIAELKLALEDATHGISATTAKDEAEALKARVAELEAHNTECREALWSVRGDVEGLQRDKEAAEAKAARLVEVARRASNTLDYIESALRAFSSGRPHLDLTATGSLIAEFRAALAEAGHAK